MDIAIPRTFTLPSFPKLFSKRAFVCIHEDPECTEDTMCGPCYGDHFAT